MRNTLSSKISWSQQSNAFDRPRNKEHVNSLLSKLLRVRLSAGSYQDLVNWYCGLLTRRTVCGRAAGNSRRT